MTTTSIARRVVATAAAGAAIACVAAAAPADAAVSHHGKIYFVIGGDSKHPIAIMHGAMNGTATDDPNHDNYDVLKFVHGSMRIVHPEAQAKFVPTFNPKTCYASFVETGAFRLSHGTGRFSGIKASGTYTTRGAAFAPRKKSGACNFNTEPKVEIFTVDARGTLK